MALRPFRQEPTGNLVEGVLEEARAVDMIELSGVSRWFDQLLAVDQVSLNVAEGEIVGLLGHNGAGKTTLIRVINGLLTPHTGSVRVLGQDPVTHGREVRRTTGVLTEYPALDEWLSVRENLEIYAAINGVRESVAAARIEDLMARLGLVDKGDEPARELSAGLKQRVALARALVHDPSVLLLDEPTTNMDPVAARDVRSLVVEAAHKRGRGVLLSTHNLAEAEELCDRVGIIRNGRLLAVGSPAELRRAFGGERGVRITTARHAARTLEGAINGRATATVVSSDTVEVTGPIETPALLAHLVREGIELHRVEPVEPTLEDLYLALHDRGPAPAVPT